MASLSHTKLLTLADLQNIPERDGFRYELRNGEIIEMPPPVLRHHKIQQRLRKLLEVAAQNAGEVTTEFGFTTDDANYRIVDVAFIALARWNAADTKYFVDAPDLAAEILSPSNRAAEMNERKKFFLEHGSREFWILDPDLRTVEVSTPDRHSITYQPGQRIALFFASEASLEVNAIFD